MTTSSRSPSGALCQHVDVAGIDQRISVLPGEISVLRVSIREVSRGHSSWSNEPMERSEDSQPVKDRTLSCSKFDKEVKT